MFSTPVTSKFSERSISLHLVNTAARRNPDVAALYRKAVRGLRGGLLPLSALATPHTSLAARQREPLECSARLVSSLPVSSVLAAYLAEAGAGRAGQPGRCTLQLGGRELQLEHSGGCSLPRLLLAGFTSLASFPLEAGAAVVWNSEVTVWAGKEAGETFPALLAFLRLSGQCAVLRAGQSGQLQVRGAP